MQHSGTGAVAAEAADTRKSIALESDVGMKQMDKEQPLPKEDAGKSVYLDDEGQKKKKDPEPKEDSANNLVTGSSKRSKKEDQALEVVSCSY